MHLFPVSKWITAVCCNPTLFTTERLYARGLTMISVLLTLAGRKGQCAMIFLVKEASESRLLGQRLLSCKTLLIPASGSSELALLT